jgi:tetratricopeptide (TPR) repeat protein
VAREIEVRLTQGEEERLAAAQPLEAESLRLYLKGRYHWNLRTSSDLELSREYFEEVIERDPTFAYAWAGLADALGQLYGYSYMPPVEAFPAAREAAREALRLDPGLAEAYASLGLVAFNLDWDAVEAEAAFQRAIELEPSYATAHQWYSELLSLVGRHREALEEIELAWGLDPFSPVVRAAMGQRLNAAGRYAEALDRLNDALEIQPRLTWAHRERALALERLGRKSEALDARFDEARARGLEGDRLNELEAALAEQGMVAFWAWQLERLEGFSATRWVPPVLMAEALAGLGKDERAFEWLDRSLEARGLYLPHTMRSTAFDAVREHPRFIAVERTYAEAIGTLPG